MEIEESLDLVRGAVNERNLVPVLTHFCIHEGRIHGSNGRVSINAPFEAYRDEAVVVPAIPFHKAIDKCEWNPIVEFAENHLVIKSKVRKMRRIRLPLSGDTYSKPIVSGTRYEIPPGYREALYRVREFISKDASRPWAMGVLHQDGYLYATNNVVLVRTKFDWPAEWPIVGVPSFAIDELLRITRLSGRPMIPKYIWIDDNSVSYEYENDVWLHSVLYEADWPDVQSMIPDCSDLPKLPHDFRHVTEDMVPFNEDEKFPIVKYSGKRISTLEGDMIAEDELEDEVAEAAFHAIPLQMVLHYAERMDLSPYPKPCPFTGMGLEGVIVGVRI